jgi:MoaA/NifB/PqqE/SkfB family radical SAM enzyme
MKKIIPVFNQTESIVKFPDKNLKGSICMEPFKTLSVVSNGNLLMCGCAPWLPTSIGNIFEDTATDALNSTLAQDIRDSILDGSYRYCDGNKCKYINNNQLNNIDDFSENDRDLLESGKSLIKTFFIAGDRTCNLSCPSCRTEVIKNKEWIASNNMHSLSSIIPLIKDSAKNDTETKTSVFLSTSGEFLSSPLLLEFLENFSEDELNNIEFNFQTNGLLFISRWHRIKHLKNNIKSISISVDSCRPEVYRKLRRGGELSDLEENLKFISNLKSELGFIINLKMIIQRDNYNEIEQFYHWGKSLGADVIEYVKLVNWKTFSDEEYTELNVLDKKHPLYKFTVDSLSDLVSHHKDAVLVDFSIN